MDCIIYGQFLTVSRLLQNLVQGTCFALLLHNQVVLLVFLSCCDAVSPMFKLLDDHSHPHLILICLIPRESAP